MKRYIKFCEVLSVVVLVGVTYVSPAYSQDGHSQQGHEMKHGKTHHEPVDTIMGSYLIIKEKLANDILDGIASEAKKIVHQVGLMEKKHDKHSDHKENKSSQLMSEIGKQAAHMSHGKIKMVRKQFAALSETLIEYLKKSEKHNKLFTFYCPMEKYYWLQDNEKVANPYFGSKMLTCGKIVKDEPAKKMMHKMEKNGHEHHNEH